MSISDKGGFTEHAPRPPVPGEEGVLVCSDGQQPSNISFSLKTESLKCEASIATPRRPDLDLGYEPEGSASPTPPYVKWAESLHSLLDDRDGIPLFQTFLKQERCADILDFWFLCSGFKLEAYDSDEEKRVKLAKAIYKKYILDNSCIVSRWIKPATKSFIKDCVLKLHIDPAMFDQAQTEIQALIEENTYPMFLKSDIYLEYAQTGGESPKLYNEESHVSASEAGLSGYFSPLEEDWKCDREPVKQPQHEPTPSHRLTQKLLMETTSQHGANSARLQERPEFRQASSCSEPIHPFCVPAPTTSTNDSEQQSMSSDADTLSLPDSSADGVPPYRSHKQHRREMQEGAKANGRLRLPPMPKERIPKNIHVEPERFAAELISRLEGVLREREHEEKLEEGLQSQLDDKGDDIILPTGSLLPYSRSPSSANPLNYNSNFEDISPFLKDSHEENPENILDDHVQRVMKSPVCQSPGTGRHSRSPDGVCGGPDVSQSWSQAKHQSWLGLKREGGHHHKQPHRSHHAASVKPKELVEGDRAGWIQGSFSWETGQHGSKTRSYADGMGSDVNEHSNYGIKGGTQCKRTLRKGDDVPTPAEELEKNHKILLWLMEGQKEMVRHKRNGSTTGPKKVTGHEGSGLGSAERPGSHVLGAGSHSRNIVQPSHPFIQDPTMPPNPAPNPLIQLEEVRRRLEEEQIQSGHKQRYVMEVIQRGRTAVRPPLIPLHSVVPGVSDSEFSESELKTIKKLPCENITVAYYFCGEPIPYRTSVKGKIVTLGQFKELLTKKGNYRYFFKRASDEFKCGVVFQEVREDDAILPVFEEKIVGKVEKID
ncbi:axin-1 [Synchiropus splendidus]|uniref:axin-1 n=1 Tax=Synchiropus splendidus TaxID=270530 RepID=UPI00237E21D6|nr:axin-1 [Synchiropus splendidus]XP_053706794.1 axin-1 [Synchiropus splendidus]